MSALENILGMLPDRVGEGKNSQIYTPPHIAEEMVNALPDDIWNKDTTFFDICCKSGIFLYYIYMKLMESPSMIADFPNETDRATHIVHKQLFGIAPNTFCKMFSTRTVYGYLEPDSHIISLGDNYNHVMQNPDRRFLLETLKKEFGTMKFDVVIGNPPYNRGMDLDFVNLGFERSNKYVCMITPAKWQTAEGEQKIASKTTNYKWFRDKLVPHISTVVFYPDSYDLFAISQADGITYYVIDKQCEVDKCHVVNKCYIQPYINSEVDRNIKNGETLWNIGQEILDYLGDYCKFQFLPTDNSKLYKVNINKQMALGGMGYRVQEMGEDGHWHLKKDIVGKGGPLFSQDGNLYALGKTSILKNNQEATSGTSLDIFWTDSIEECKSFYSYINSKFVRFLLLINTVGLSGISNKETWKYVPAPDLKEDGDYDWSKIYTDEYLYEKFNLPQKYIDIIEAVIKERK